MTEILQSFTRTVLALLSGAMILAATCLLTDSITGYVFETLKTMLNDAPSRTILASIAGVAAYGAGIVNVAGSSLLFRRRVEWDDELVLISRVEAARLPQVLKETLDYLSVKRTLIAFSLPLTYFGIAFALDHRKWQPSPVPPIACGLLLAVCGVGAPFIARSIQHLLDASATKLETRSA